MILGLSLFFCRLDDVGRSAMGFMDGRRSRFRIGDIDGTMRDLSASITEVRGLPGERVLNEVTALGDSGARFEPGADDVAFSVRGLFDDTAVTGEDAVLGALRFHDSPTPFEYEPAGPAAGKVCYFGNCWVRSYELRSRAGEPVSWVATLQVEGEVSRS